MINQDLDLQRFYKACNPAKTLNMANPEERKYYIDFSQVRGTGIINKMYRTISKISPDEPTCQLFTGHTGCGKTTELLRLKHKLEKSGFHVVYFEATDDIEIGDIDISDILLSIVSRISLSLEKVAIQVRPSYFEKLFEGIKNILNTPINFQNLQFSAGIASITAQTQASPTQRDRLRAFLEPRTPNIVEAINEQLLKPSISKLLEQGKKGLVVIIDNLDRIENVLKPNGHPQPEYLFIDRGERLTKLQCHVIYTIPLILTFNQQLEMLTTRFGTPQLLPMVRVKNRDGTEFQKGMSKMRQMVLTRAFPDIDIENRNSIELRNLINKVFYSPQTLDHLCLISGGHVRNLLNLLYSCLQQVDPPFSDEVLNSVVTEKRDFLKRTITDIEWDRLVSELQENPWIGGEAKYLKLIQSLLAFEYEDSEGKWFAINPLLEKAFD